MDQQLNHLFSLMQVNSRSHAVQRENKQYKFAMLQSCGLGLRSTLPANYVTTSTELLYNTYIRII